MQTKKQIEKITRVRKVIIIGRIIFLPLFLLVSFYSLGQFVGIGTNAPQKTLDVRGNHRFGGINKFIEFDSLSGKISWSNSYLFLPAPQYIIQHSASAEGLHYQNSQLEYLNSTGNPVFFTNWSNGNGYFSKKLGIGRSNPDFPLSFADSLGEKISLYGDSSYHYGLGIQPFLLQIYSPDGAHIAFGNGSSFGFAEKMRIKGNGNVGIGTPNPTSTLHIMQGSAGGNTPYGPLSVESNNAAYIGLLVPDGLESGVIFGRNSDNASGGIIYNNPTTLNGLQFRTNGNTNRMVIDDQGRIGIGTDLPQASLDVYRTSPNQPTANFYGSQNISHFNFNTDEDTYIRSGKNNRFVILNDIVGGKVGIGIAPTIMDGVLEVNGRARIRSGGTLGTSAGLWLNNTNNSAQSAFFGMEDNNHVGLFGANGAGWKFTMNTQSGALRINGSEGQAGQVIQSNGGASSASWANPSNIIYNNMFSYFQSSTATINNNSSAVLPGISGTINVTSMSKAIVSYLGYGTSIGCSFCGSSSIGVFIKLDNANPPFDSWSLELAFEAVPNGATTGLGNGFLIATLSPGTYTVSGQAQNSGPTAQVSGSKVSIVIIPQ